MAGQHRAQAQSAAERFAELIRPKRKTERVTEDADFLRMMFRMGRALEGRADARPEILAGVIAFAKYVNEIPNVVIANSADKHAVNPYSSPSMKEIARLLKITPQSASDRRSVGNRIRDERIAASDAASLKAFRDGKTAEQVKRAGELSEAERERETVDAAAEFAVNMLADYLARRPAEANVVTLADYLAKRKAS